MREAIFERFARQEALQMNARLSVERNLPGTE
jgi:hypothetical protein